MRPVAAQKERGHRLAQRRPRRKSNGRPIEGLAVGGDSTLADATCHQHVAPGLNVPKGRVRPELVSNPRRAKRYATQRVAYLFGAPSGIRTPDTLLKRQVLCLLSYWGISV